MAKRINLFFLFLIAFILFVNVNFISAEYGVNKIQGNGVTVTTLNNNTYYVNGTFLDAGGYYLYNDTTSIYFNDTRLNETIDARASAGEVLWSANYTLFNSTWSSIYNSTYNDAWKYVTNGTFYPIGNPSGFFNLSDFDIADYYPLVNPYSYYNSTTLPSTETLWNANYSLYNVSWSSIFNQTYHDAWKYTTNNSFYPYTSNPFGYLNTSSEALWSANYSLFNDTWSSVYNASYYLVTNPFGFYNSTSWNNPYNYTNKTLLSQFDNDLTLTETLWSANFSLYNSSWSSINNASYVPYSGAGANVDLGSFDLTAHNLYAGYLGGTVGSLDMSADPWILAANLTPATTLRQNIGSGPARWNIIYVSNVSTDYVDASHEIYASGNITAGNYFIGSGAFLTDLPMGSEVDPFWSGNSTLVYLKTNPYSFYNSTSWNNPYTYYNTTSWNNPYFYWNSTFADFNKTYADTLYSPITEPLWSGNYSLYNNSWATTYNATYDAYNSTGLIINWSTLGFDEQDPFWSRNFTANNDSWNSINNATYNEAWLLTTNGTFYKRITNEYNYTNKTLLSQFQNDGVFITWDKVINGTVYTDNTHSYWNSTFADFNKTYADTLYSTKAEPLWSANYTLFNSTWSSTYNATYNTWAYNQTIPANAYSDSLLITTFFNHSAVNVVRGTPQGTDESINTYDNVAYNITEESGAVGMDFIINFSGITSFNQIIFRTKDENTGSITSNVYIWDYDEGIWESYAVLSTLTDYVVKEIGVYDETDHISGGIVQVRFLQSANGNINRKHIFDWIILAEGPATPSGAEVDPYSLHLTDWYTNYSTLYLNTNSYSFYNSTSWNNPYNYTNFTKLSDYTNDLTFYIDNIHSYWNSTFADFNKTYADTLYSTKAEPLWSANLTANNATWNKDLWNTTEQIWAVVYNGTLALNSSLLGYYPIVNPYGYWNDTYALFNKTYADTLYSPLGGNEADPFWSANLTANNATWNSFANNYSTYLANYTNVLGNYTRSMQFITWVNATNGTLALNSSLSLNYFNYTNKTLLSQFQNDLSSTDTFAGNYSTYLANYTLVLGNFTTLLSKISWDKVINGTIWAQVLNGTMGLATEPLWSANLTANNATWNSFANNYSTFLSHITWDKVINGTIWSQVLNGTMASWINVANGTMMSQATFNTNWSTFVHEPRWTANLTVINATMRLNSNNTFNGDMGLVGQLNMTKGLNVSSGNITIPTASKICLNGNTCTQWMLANSSGVYIQG